MRTLIGLLLALALLVVPARPGDYYVDRLGGLDGNPGTQAQPWQTIQKALDTIPDGDHSLYVKATATYDETTLGYINFKSSEDPATHPWDNLTIYGCPSDSWVPVTDPANGPMITPTSVNYCFKVENTHTGGIITVQGFRISPTAMDPAADAYGIWEHGTSTTSVVFSKCTITVPATLASYRSVIQTGAIGGGATDFTFSYCTITATGVGRASCYIRSFRDFTVDHCTWTTGTSTGGILTLDGAVRSVTLTNNTITTCMFADCNTVSAVASGGRFVFTNNTCTYLSVVNFEPMLKLTKRWPFALITDNTFTRPAASMGGAMYVQYGTSTEGDATAPKGLQLLRNTFLGPVAGAGNASDHAVLLGFNTTGIVAYNTLRDLSTDPSGFGIVVKGDNYGVYHNQLYGTRNPLYVVGGRYNRIAHNTVVTHEAHALTAPMAFNFTAAGLQAPIYNSVTHNIFYCGPGGGQALAYFNNGATYVGAADRFNYIDDNIYIGGDHLAWLQISGADQPYSDTLAALRTRWTAVAPSATNINDQRSEVVLSPGCVNPLAGDMRIRHGAAALYYGMFNTAVGAWGRPAPAWHSTIGPR